MALTATKIGQLIDEISVASLRSWLKSQGFEHSANTRDQMAQRLLKLLQSGDLSEQELESAVSNIEEASSKRIVLCELPEVPNYLQTPTEFGKYLNGADKKLSQKPQRAPRLPSNPTLVYVAHSQNQIRAKWAETQTRIEVDYASLEISQKRVTKVVVMVADLKTKLIQLRYDKPEIRQIHKTKDDYVKYYREQAPSTT